MNNYKISIIIPCYNVEEYLPKCLDSIINQTYKNLEIICINDGSKDNTLDILNEYKKSDDRIIVIDQENQGLSGARNTGIINSNGDYIMFVDSDDWIDQDTCEKALKEAIENNCDVVIWNYVREFVDASKEQYIFGKEKINFKDNDYINCIYRRVFGLINEELSTPEKADSIVTAWGKLYKRTLIIDNDDIVSFVDTKLIGTEDALFNVYALGNANSAVYLPNCFNHYRKTNIDSLTSTYKPNLFSQWKKLYDLIDEYIASNELGEEFIQALNNRICLSIIGLGLNILRAGKQINKVKEIKNIISFSRYRSAYKQLKLKYFPFHWKVFFLFAKYNFAFGVYLMLNFIRILKR